MMKEWLWERQYNKIMEPLYLAISIISAFMMGCIFMFIMMRMYVNQWRGMVNKLLTVNKLVSDDPSPVSVTPSREDHIPHGYEDVV